MRLPADAKDRFKIYRNLVRQIAADRDDRKARYRRLRTWYLTGSAEGMRATYNKLAEYVDYSASYLYAQESVRFGVALPPHYGEAWMQEADSARDELHRLWHDSDAGLIFGVGVTWAHVWDSVVFKVFVSQNQPHLELLSDPSDFAVLHPDLNDWDRQEALCHWYLMDLPSFWRLISTLPNEDRRRELWESAQQQAVPAYEATGDTLPPTIQRILVSATSPNLIGAVQSVPDTMLAVPRVTDPVVKLAELWVKDDARGDYRVAKLLTATDDVIWDPLNPLIPGEHPFHPLTLGPTPGYAWGICPLERLLSLQQLHELKLTELNERDELQLNPPIFFKRMATLDGEKAKIFRRPGGNITASDPGAEATPIVPAPLPDPGFMLDKIHDAFARVGGLPRGMVGQTEPGTRSGEQAMVQAMLGAGPTLSRAMLVEDVLEAVATALLRLHRRVSDTTLKKADGTEFLLSQMPGDFVARVWAHSHSPLYQQQLVQRAVLAKDRGAIDSEDFLEFLNLPGTDVQLRAKARKLAEAAAAQKERVIEIAERKAEKGKR